MAAERKFTHKGVTVLVYRKSIKLTGMHDVIYMGHEPSDDQVKRMIDAIQAAASPVYRTGYPKHSEGHPVRSRLRKHPSLFDRPPSLRERFIRWWYKL